MKKEFVKVNRKQIIQSLEASDISRRIDKMDLHREYNYYLLDDAKKACKESYKRIKETICCNVYVTARPGTFGYQFLSAVWIKIDGNWYQASGSLTSGYGYDKESTAIEYALRAVGLDRDKVDYFGGTGQQEQILDELMSVLAGRKAWFKS